MIAVIRPPKMGRPLTLQATHYLDEPGAVSLFVPSGPYLAIAFEDLDRDQALDRGERAHVSGTLRVRPGEALEAVLSVDRPWTEEGLPVEIDDQRIVIIGKLADLSDRRFQAPAGAEGVWQSLAAVEDHPAGLFVLGPFDDRVPVVFVHGIGGFAAEFDAMTRALDPARFQPWVLQYPSGLRLDAPAQLLQRAVREMRARRPTVPRAIIVAHSMGGLVSRHSLTLMAERAPDAVACFVTLASPLGGMDSAAAGVASSPVVVPAWRDVASGSAFVRELYAVALDERIPYALFYAFGSHTGASDGVVPIASQLRREARDEASEVVGFPVTHTGILADDAVLAELRRVLDECLTAAPASAGLSQGRTVGRSGPPRSGTPPASLALYGRAGCPPPSGSCRQ